jgi:hypothetical protein
MKVCDQLHTPTTVSLGKGSSAMHSTGNCVGSRIADKTQMASISLNFELKNTKKKSVYIAKITRNKYVKI